MRRTIPVIRSPLPPEPGTQTPRISNHAVSMAEVDWNSKTNGISLLLALFRIESMWLRTEGPTQLRSSNPRSRAPEPAKDDNISVAPSQTILSSEIVQSKAASPAPRVASRSRSTSSIAPSARIPSSDFFGSAWRGTKLFPPFDSRLQHGPHVIKKGEIFRAGAHTYPVC